MVTLYGLARPSVELQELLIEAEDPNFELKNEGSGLSNACLSLEECSHSFNLILAKLDSNYGQLQTLV